MSDIMVSVIMPVYNAQAYLKQAVESVLHQTLRDLELICVDDGSTDGSLALLEELQETDQRMKVFHQQNQFAGVARNYGLARARGKYVIFWDADDWFSEQALEKLVIKAQEDNAQICICGAEKFDESSRLRYPTDEYLIWRRVPEKQPFSKREIGKYLYNFCSNVPWNKLFLRSFVLDQKLSFQPLRQANDIYFVMLALFYAERISAVHEQLIVYRTSNAGSVTGRASLAKHCTAEALEAVYDRLNQEPAFSGAIRQSFANKTIGPLMNVLRLQASAEEARGLYQEYREKLMPKFGLFGQNEDFFHNPIDDETMRMMQDCSYEDFMLYYARRFSQRYRLEEGKRRASELELQAARRELKKTQRELEWLKNSWDYKIGSTAMKVPRMVKRRLDRRS